jgi:uncharacterized protein YxjI
MRVSPAAERAGEHAVEPVPGVAMAEVWYQRNCRQCGGAWLVPASIAEERPNIQSITSQVIGQVTSTYDQQLAMRAHYQQLASAAKCPHCGATSFTQARYDGPPPAPAPADPAGPAASVAAAPPASARSAIPAPPSPAIPAPPPPPTGQIQTFVLNQNLFSLTGDAWIDDGQGNRAFAVDGSLLTLRGTHVLKDLDGTPLYEISKPLTPHLHDTISISRGSQSVATVQKALVNMTGDRFKIQFVGGQALAVRGDWMNREFQVVDQTGQQVMSASRAWFTFHDAYGIQVAPGFDAPLGLAIAIALERVETGERGSSPLKDLLGDFNPF